MTGIQGHIAGTNGAPQPIRGVEVATILGPRNVQVELQNPDLLVPPTTDSGTIPNFKYSFERHTLGCCRSAGRAR